jgi:hypothetical protein
MWLHSYNPHLTYTILVMSNMDVSNMPFSRNLTAEFDVGFNVVTYFQLLIGRYKSIFLLTIDL